MLLRHTGIIDVLRQGQTLYRLFSKHEILKMVLLSELLSDYDAAKLMNLFTLQSVLYLPNSLHNSFLKNEWQFVHVHLRIALRYAIEMHEGRQEDQNALWTLTVPFKDIVRHIDHAWPGVQLLLALPLVQPDRNALLVLHPLLINVHLINYFYD